MSVTACTCCGHRDLEQLQILWPELVEEWSLSPDEARYIERQQGLCCRACGVNLRSMALATAVMMAAGFDGVFADFVAQADGLRLLEVNPAGQLTQFLERIPGHVLTTFPDVDMAALPFDDQSFDLVVHSDTLEHVPDPVQGLAECGRVTTRTGTTCFTVPVVVGRRTRSRGGLPPSYHGSEADPIYLVHTEYGADTWCQVLQAGFAECRISCLEYPSALAFTAACYTATG